MTIEPSLIVWTVLCFLALMVILKKLLFQPMLALMDARSAKIEAARKAKEQARAEHDEKLRRMQDEHAAQAAQLHASGEAALERAHEEFLRRSAEKRSEITRRLEENHSALVEESERIARELEPQLSDVALDLVNHLQHWQDDRHSAVDAESVAAPYADMERLTAGEHTNATTNRTK